MSTPTMVSLIVCDQVIDDRLTNKKSAIGLFNRIMTRSEPITIPSMTVMASLTEITGQADVELRLVRDSDNESIFSTQGTIQSPSPLSVVDLVFNMQGLSLPTSGQYGFELWSETEMLGRRRFHVSVSSGTSGSDGASNN